MTPVSVYIAAPSQMIDEAMVLKHLLADSGIACTSGWISHGLTGDTNESAMADLADVAKADVLVALNPELWKTCGTGGRHVEMGYALGLGKPVIVLGSRTNVFHYLDTVDIALTVNDLVLKLTDRMCLSDVRR